ncbi:MAG: HEAT repeat domain-containing protein [Acidobacteriia bacterium]|nr:HEAT repeat domain-containing protein [Terriglobia bacterium]
MNCDAVLNSIPLYFYGELAPTEEDELEEHLHACPDCALEMERQRALAAALSGRQIEPSAAFLDHCRQDLMGTILGRGHQLAIAPARLDVAGASHLATGHHWAASQGRPGPWRLFLDAMAETFSGFERLRLPLGAAAMVALGFFSARVTTTHSPTTAEAVFPTVRSIQPDGSGRVQISVDETSRRLVTGRMDDEKIQQLLLAAARGDNPAARLESLGVLKDRADSSPVRDALLNAVAHDPNPGVRLAALEGLKPLSGDQDVRKVLAQVLLADDNPAIRMQVVDLLTTHRDDAIVGVLQDLMQKENNNYVRMKSEQALKAMNASVGTF